MTCGGNLPPCPICSTNRTGCLLGSLEWHRTCCCYVRCLFDWACSHSLHAPDETTNFPKAEDSLEASRRAVPYLARRWQGAVFIHLPPPFYLRPCSQKGLFGGGEGILGLRCLLFCLLPTCPGSSGCSSLWCHDPVWKAQSRNTNDECNLILDKLRHARPCHLPSPWINTNGSIAHVTLLTE